jgi:hypothetical protein
VELHSVTWQRGGRKYLQLNDGTVFLNIWHISKICPRAFTHLPSICVSETITTACPGSDDNWQSYSRHKSDALNDQWVSGARNTGGSVADKTTFMSMMLLMANGANDMAF